MRVWGVGTVKGGGCSLGGGASCHGEDRPSSALWHAPKGDQQVWRGSNGRGWLQAVDEQKGRWGTGPPLPPPCAQWGGAACKRGSVAWAEDYLQTERGPAINISTL
jgi:hypothetical protein